MIARRRLTGIPERVLHWVCLAVLVVPAMLPSPVRGASVTVEPPQGEVVIGKKPVIRAVFDTDLDPGTLYVLLDNTDITALVDLDVRTITYAPPIPLYGGWHSVTVQGAFADGSPVNFGWTFQLKHTEALDEISFGADLTVVYSATLDEEEPLFPQPDWSLELTGPTLFTLITGNKGLSLEGTAYYLQQEGDLAGGVAEEGFDYRDFRLTGTWVGQKGTGEIQVGDLSVTETSLVSPALARRGVLFSYTTGQVGLNVYSLGATPVFGVRDGLKVSLDPDKSILGSSVRWVNKEGRTSVHLAYMTGTEDLSGSFASGGSSVPSEGDAFGVALNHVFGSGRVSGFLEGALSSYDPDLSDTQGKDRDQALAAGATWRATDRLDYTLKLQRVGSDFKSIGNTGAVQNVENVSLSNGIHLEKHDINLLVHYAQDNLDNDASLPTSQYLKTEVSDRITLDQNLAAGLLLFRESLDTDDEPAGFVEERSTTDHTALDLSYSQATWNLRPFVSTTSTDVKSGLATDTSVTEYRLDLSLYPSSRLSLLVTLPQIINEEVDQGADTDSFLTSLQLNAQPFGDHVSLDLAGSYSDTEASDDSLDETVTEYTARIAYSLRPYFSDYLVPQVVLGGIFRTATDRVLDVDTDEYRIYLNLELLSTIRL